MYSFHFDKGTLKTMCCLTFLLHYHGRCWAEDEFYGF